MVWCVAVPARADLLFHTGFDSCWIDSTADLHAWSAGSGTPTVSTSVDVSAYNYCALNFAVASGASVYRQTPTFTAQDTAYATIRFKCATFPTSSRPLLTFYNTSSSKRGATLWIGPAPGDTSKFQLRAYYQSIGPSCTASHTMDGTPCGGSCTTVADCVQGGGVGEDVLACESNVCVHECDETAQGESLCAAFANAFSGYTGLSPNTYYLATLGHAKGTGQVTVSLYNGPAGASPASIPMGATTHKEGICSGGTGSRHLMACATTGDCTGTDTCDTSDVIQVNAVRIGADETSSGGSYDCTIDELWVEDSGGPNPNGSMLSVQVISQGATGNWSSVGSAHSCGAGTEYACLQDGASPDSDTSAIANSNAPATQPTIGLNIPAFPTVTAPMPSPTPRGLAIELIGKNHAASGTGGVQLDVTDNTGTSTGSAWAFSAFSDSGASATYHALPPRQLTRRSTGGNWTWGALTINNVATLWKTGASDAVRLSSMITTAWFDRPDPAVPTSLRDHDGDGEITVTLAGDSTWADLTFAQLTGSALIQPTNVLVCALGGTTVGDLRGDLDDILHGRTTQYMRCLAYKGATGKKADVLLVGPGANNFRQGNYTDPANITELRGRGQAVYCDMKGGAGEGAVCSCPLNSAQRHKDGLSTRYWRLRNQYWKQPTLTCSWSEAACYSHADCGSAGICTAGQCASQLAYITAGCDVASGGMLDVCVPGCLNAPGCPQGLCIANSADDQDFAQLQDIVTTAERYAWAPIVIPATASVPLQADRGYACWFGTMNKVDAYNARLRAWAKATGRPFVDIAARQKLLCPTLAAYSSTETPTLCLRDPIHKNGLGNALASDVLVDAITAAANTGDGVCAAGLCTAGMRNDACSANADCDTWRTPAVW